MKKSLPGFTLIEMMVVLAVIAILATMALFGIDKARAASRDAQRQQTMTGIQTALERYYADKQEYPITSKFADAMVALLPPAGYLATAPTDPKCSVTYSTSWEPCGSGVLPKYTYTSTGQSYTMTLSKESGGVVPFNNPN